MSSAQILRAGYSVKPGRCCPDQDMALPWPGGKAAWQRPVDPLDSGWTRVGMPSPLRPEAAEGGAIFPAASPRSLALLPAVPEHSPRLQIHLPPCAGAGRREHMGTLLLGTLQWERPGVPGQEPSWPLCPENHRPADHLNHPRHSDPRMQVTRGKRRLGHVKSRVPIPGGNLGCQDHILSTSAQQQPPSNLPDRQLRGNPKPAQTDPPHALCYRRPGVVGLRVGPLLEGGCSAPSASLAGTPPCPQLGASGSLSEQLTSSAGLRARFPRGEMKVGASPRLLPRKAPAKPHGGRLAGSC